MLLNNHILLAERVGFEPTEVLPSPVFKTGAIDQTLPSLDMELPEGLEPPTFRLQGERTANCAMEANTRHKINFVRYRTQTYLIYKL